MVADGTLELAGGDAPAARHAQVFALAERLGPLVQGWGVAAPRRLGVWLLDQPEIDDVFGDDADLLEHLHGATRTLA